MRLREEEEMRRKLDQEEKLGNNVKAGRAKQTFNQCGRCKQTEET